MKKRLLNQIVSMALLLAMALSLLPAGAAAEEETQYGYLVIHNNTVNRVVNFRRLPNTNDDTNYPIARLPEYWVVEVLGKENGWYKISANINLQGGSANLRTGYVMESFLALMTAEEQARYLASPTALFVPGGAASPSASPSPTPTATVPVSTETAAPASQGYLRTVLPDVNVRLAPGGTAITPLSHYPVGTVLAYSAVVRYNQQDWALVRYNDQGGYLSADCYVLCDAQGNPLDSSSAQTPTAAPSPTAFIGTPAQTTYGRVIADNVFFRKTANTNGDFWTRLPAGWILEVLQVLNPAANKGVTWYKVKGSIPSNPSRTYTGYIHGDFFSLIEASPTVTASPAPAENSSYALVILDAINLRQTPGGATVALLQVNTVVNVLSVPAGNTANDWYYVEIAGQTGYLPATALRVLTTAELGSYVLPASPVPALTPTAAPAPAAGGYVKLVKDKVNIRKTPAGTVLTPKDSDKMRVGTVLAYTEGPVYVRDYNWVLITYQGITGYVRGDCYMYCDENGGSTPAPTATPIAPAVTSGAATPDPTDSPNINQGYIKLIKGGVNLRASVWGSTLGQLSKGTILPYFNIIRNANNASELWYEVYSSKTGSFGFILSTMAEVCDAQGNPVTPGALPTSSPVTVMGYVATTASSVWLRKTPKAGADTLGQVKAKGTVLPLIGSPVQTDYEWYPVETSDGVRAYLRGDYVFVLADWQLELYNKTGALATPTPAPATPRPGNSEYLQVVGGALWIRQTPSKKAGTVGQLPDKTIIRFYAKQTVSNVVWYQVAYGGQTGWVMGTYTRVLSNAEYDQLHGTATPAPSATPQASVDPTQFSDLAITTADRVRIRAGGSMSSKELYMVYQSGTVMTYLGKYTAPTQTNPYYWYNVKYQGVTGWMCGDFVRVLTTAEKAAYQQTGTPDTPQEATYRTLYKNSSGEDVTKLQQKLVELGYLDASQVTGVYLSSTESAVIAFQRAYGLTVDGIAGSKTQHALYGTVEPGTSVNTDGSSVAVTLYPVEKSDWFTGDIQKIWTNGSVAIITDVYTGISFRAQRLYGDNHADCEPLTAADSAAVYRIYGVSSSQEIEDREQELQSYRRRPLWVTIGGRTFAASMYGVPHNYKGDRISDNNYMGQFCIHFTNSMTHGDSSNPAHVDTDAGYNNYFGHQSAINYAYTHSISGTK